MWELQKSHDRIDLYFEGDSELDNAIKAFRYIADTLEELKKVKKDEN